MVGEAGIVRSGTKMQKFKKQQEKVYMVPYGMENDYTCFQTGKDRYICVSLEDNSITAYRME